MGLNRLPLAALVDYPLALHSVYCTVSAVNKLAVVDCTR